MPRFRDLDTVRGKMTEKHLVKIAQLPGTGKNFILSSEKMILQGSHEIHSTKILVLIWQLVKTMF